MSESSKVSWEKALEDDPSMCGLPIKVIDTFLPTEKDKVLWLTRSAADRLGMERDEFIEKAYDFIGKKEKAQRSKSDYSKKRDDLIEMLGSKEKFKELGREWYKKHHEREQVLVYNGENSKYKGKQYKGYTRLPVPVLDGLLNDMDLEKIRSNFDVVE